MSDTFQRITELDNDAIVENLIKFYENQDYWKDYNFRGGGLNTLIRSMAYALHYGGFYGNMLASESALPNSQIRNSAVSHAKPLSYTPRSITASKALIDIVSGIPGSGPTNTLTIRKGTRFRSHTTDENGVTSENVFITTKSYTSTVTPGQSHAFNDVEIFEGRYRSIEFVVDKTNINQVFLLPHAGIDVNFLEVYVQEGADNLAVTTYKKAEGGILVNSTDKVFFVEEYRDGIYHIFFGDGIIGQDLANGKIVRVVYFETSGPAANNSSKFTLVDDGRNEGLSTIVPQIIVRTSSGEGTDAETIESIKFFAPRKYAAANRAFGVDDWKSIILSEFPSIRNAKIWGGEEEPRATDSYGKVFIALNRVGGGPVARSVKDQIVSVMKSKYRIMEVTPVIVDPEFIYIAINTSLSIDTSSRNVDTSNIVNNVKSALLRFSSTTLEDFDDVLEMSKLATIVDASDPLITGSNTIIKIETRQPIDINRLTTYTTNFRNKIRPGSLSTSTFVWGGESVYLTDDGNGGVSIARSSNSEIAATGYGTVDYETGIVSIKPIVIQRGLNDSFNIRFVADPRDTLIDSKRNKILVVDPSQIQVRFR